MAKTREEIDRLKESWMHDPNWDIEQTDGFEEHAAELIEFREQKEAEWHEKALQDRIKRGQKVGALTGIYDPDLAEHLFTFDEIERSVQDARSDFELRRSQVRATLLLTAQVKRIADMLGEQIDRSNGEHDRDFMTSLYNVE